MLGRASEVFFWTFQVLIVLFRALWSAERTAAVHEFLKVVHQTVEAPLGGHLLPCSIGKATESFVMPQIGKDRLHDRQPLTVDLPGLRRVDLHPHLLAQGLRRLHLAFFGQMQTATAR